MPPSLHLQLQSDLHCARGWSFSIVRAQLFAARDHLLPGVSTPPISSTLQSPINGRPSNTSCLAICDGPTPSALSCWICTGCGPCRRRQPWPLRCLLMLGLFAEFETNLRKERQLVEEALAGRGAGVDRLLCSLQGGALAPRAYYRSPSIRNSEEVQRLCLAARWRRNLSRLCDLGFFAGSFAYAPFKTCVDGR
jgi:hypothetical protein